LVFYNRHFGDELGIVEFNKDQISFLNEVKETEAEILHMMEQVKIRDALKGILALGKMGNKFFQDEKPWEQIKVSKDQTRSSLMVLIYLVRDIGILLSPYMPDTSERIERMLNRRKGLLNQVGDWEEMKTGKIGKPEILFKKLQPDEIKQYKQKYSGLQNQIKTKTKSPLDAWKNVEIKVGVIQKVEKHPTADRLYVETIDCGEKAVRTIVSGIVKHYSESDLIGKKVLVVTNLIPAELRGVLSEGMLLTAEKRKKLEVIELEDCAVGTVVTLEGIENNPMKSLDINGFLECGISVCDHVLQIEGRDLLAGNEPIKTKKIANGKVR
ncbi:MAG: class I tRNA ligase family protein, partial [Proteobacteria bacterium]|nr:class I tRNA ligase family protein [Pseudomonadota bacterium]